MNLPNVEMYDSVCIGGAGVRGICELGALHYYVKSLRLDTSMITTYTGTSVGAGIALLLLVGYSPIEIFYYVTKVEQWIDLTSVDVFGIHKDFGLFDVHVLTDHVAHLIERKLGCIPTLKQLHDFTLKRFAATVVNMTRSCIEYADHITYPDLSCVEAVAMSCAIPLIFKRITYNDSHYVDGGLLDNLPIGALSPNSRALIVCVSEKFSQECVNAALGHLHALSSLPIQQNQSKTIESLPKDHRHTLVKILLEDGPSAIDFNIKKQKRYDLFCVGYRAAKETIRSEKALRKSKID